MDLRLIFGVLSLWLLAGTVMGQTETERFDIQRFDVDGNTLLSVDEINTLVAPYVGARKEYGDVQRALDALEARYRELGFSAVQVSVPEQVLERGVVTLKIVESRIGRVYINDAQFFDLPNIRASLPAVKEGVSPNAVTISRNVQLANENPARQLDVVLRAGEEENVVDVDVNVKDHKPLKVFATLDNTGNGQTGNARLGVGVQHANLFNRDHAGTLNYITAPEKPDQVSIFSMSYRVPLYSLGHAVDFIVARSNVNAGATETVAGPLTFSGKGNVYGFRYNHLLQRHGEFSHRLVYGFDYKAFDNTCSLGVFGEAGCGSAGVDVTSRPVSVTYTGAWQAPSRQTDFFVSLSRNLPGGKNGTAADFETAQPSPTAGAGAPADFAVLKFGGSITSVVWEQWQARAAASAQWTRDRLIGGEQFGIVGANSVRGFLEREVARDTGVVANVEIYTPNLTDMLDLSTGNLRALAFYDFGQASNNPLAGEQKQRSTVSSVGAGLRYNIEKDLVLKFDLARVAETAGSKQRGDYRGHLSLLVSF